MVTAESRGWWRWYPRVGVAVSLAGGVIMLAVAAVAHNEASIALLIIGGLWTIMGVAGLIQLSRAVSRVELADGRLTFFGKQPVSVPTSDVVEVRRVLRLDPGRQGPLQVVTRDQRKLTIPSHMRGLLDLLVGLRAENPDIRLPEM